MREIQDEMVEMGYNCSEDTILRHMRLLREWDVEVEGSMGRNARYYLGSRLLKKEELKLIVDAINASNFIGREIADEMVQKRLFTESCWLPQDSAKNQVMRELLRNVGVPHVVALCVLLSGGVRQDFQDKVWAVIERQVAKTC